MVNEVLLWRHTINVEILYDVHENCERNYKKSKNTQSSPQLLQMRPCDGKRVRISSYTNPFIPIPRETCIQRGIIWTPFNFIVTNATDWKLTPGFFQLYEI